MNPIQFRADHIGSLLRPAGLLELRRLHGSGRLEDSQLQEAEDKAISDAVALQERVGLPVVTDGEMRRRSYHSYFFAHLGDIVPDHVPANEASAVAGAPQRAAQPVARIGSRIERTAPIHLDDFRALSALTGRVAKMTIPGPCALHFRGGDAAALATAYSDIDAYWNDIVTAFRAELLDLAAAGCQYVQIDETAFAKFSDPEVQAMLSARGDNWRKVLDLYVEITNRVLADIPGMRIGVHLCRGNRGGQFHAEGGYDVVAEKLFNELAAHHFLLEYDSPRAGDFSPLRHAPKTKGIVLGLISTKSPQLEKTDDLKRRIDDAAKFAALDNLAISPQCGFASVDTGNPVSGADQEAKLRLVVETAREVWGGV
ncbi:MAG: 5-methyltetrahydropteroyltriglutamate--homocysteine S-methyltransferase [Beijerinckiaceae bacterium]|nr:5-methyltetrahydropteroyltriglutamate--homocysteine S-methyltransferase [Beijerinckiaceae bacterium]